MARAARSSIADLERRASAFFAAHPFDGPTVDVDKLPAARFFELLNGVFDDADTSTT